MKKDFLVGGSNGKPMAADITYDEVAGPRPVLIYAHGFNGFKDWGNFDLIAKQFVAAGFTFVKFNFSHNGTTPAQPEDFVDLPAFGENNYTKELFDLEAMLNWLVDRGNEFASVIDASRIGLIGHSMGGGLAIIKTAADNRIKALCTWASISECKTPWGSWTEDRMQEWQKSGLQYYTNGRTKQEMPLYYQLYEDYESHKDQLDILAAAGNIKVPFLICHGTEDTGVPIANACRIHKANAASQLFTLAGDHVFDRKHPWASSGLPGAMQAVLKENILFFKKALS